ncbi:MAG: YccF domain-containing protein [Acidimicrobiia bacterium]
MRTLGNILWLILGGLPMAIAYAVAGLVMFALIITIPLGIQAFKLAGFALWPFGRVMVEIPGKGGCLNTIGNVIWIVLAGFWLAIGHLLSAFLLAITIIGIPFAVANVKLAGAALVPFGRTILSAEAAQAQSYAVVVGVQPLG